MVGAVVCWSAEKKLFFRHNSHKVLLLQSPAVWHLYDAPTWQAQRSSGAGNPNPPVRHGDSWLLVFQLLSFKKCRRGVVTISK